MYRKRDNTFVLNIGLIILLIIALACSLSITLSGAWFTDSDSATSSSTTLRFGTVRLGENPKVATVTVVPSQTISYYGTNTTTNTDDTAGIQYVGNVGAYYRLSFDVQSVAFVNSSDTRTLPTATAVKNYLYFTNAWTDGKMYGMLSADDSNSNTTTDVIPSGTITFSNTADDRFQNIKFVIVLTADIIQQANMSSVAGGTIASNEAQSTAITKYQNLFYFVDYNTVSETTGLAYTSIDTSTCYVSGIGSASTSMTTLKIPRTADSGDCAGKTVVGVSFGNITASDTTTAMFSTCTGLTTVIMPNTITYLDDGVFNRMTSIRNVVFSPSLTQIGEYTFNICSNLQKIDLPNSVSGIGKCAFLACGSVNALNIPTSLTQILMRAFSRINELRYVNFQQNSSVSTIEGGAFSDCGNLDYISLPSSLANVTGHFFQNCQSLFHLEVAKSNSTYSSSGNCILSKNGKIFHIGCCGSVIPSSVETISGAFSYDHATASFYIPSNVLKINANAYVACYGNLTTITLCNPTVVLNDNCFIICKDITTINFCGTQAQWTALNKTRVNLFGVDSTSKCYNTNAISIVCTDGTITWTAVA